MDPLYYSIIPLLLGWFSFRLINNWGKLPSFTSLVQRIIDHVAPKLNRGNHLAVKGLLFGLLLMGFTGWTVYLLTSIFEEWENLLGLLLLSVGVFYGFVGPSIIHTVQTIFEESENHIDVAQDLTTHISRQDTRNLEADQLKGLALNTVVERMSTHIIAPLFWFGIFDLLGSYGIAGMLTYRCLFILNKTMEGKQALSEFDRPTANIYKYANYLPSRICAFLMLLSAGLPSGGFNQVFKKYQHDILSNRQYPQNALSFLLKNHKSSRNNTGDKSLPNENIYTINDLHLTVAIIDKTEILMVIILLILKLLF